MRADGVEKYDTGTLDASELGVSERRIVTIPVKNWKGFEAWANEPAAEIQGLKELARKAPAWRK